MSGNPWVKFQRLLSPGSKMIVTVESVPGDGTSIVTLRSGATVRAAGDGYDVGALVFMQGGALVGAAPSLTNWGSVEV